MSSKLIGHVGVDSGQLLLCDPCYIDSQWEKEEFEDVRIYKHKTTGKTLEYRVHFENFAEQIPEYGADMNTLLATGEWEYVEGGHGVKHGFSYNACAQATLSEDGFGELNYKHGTSGVGVAFSTAFGDGFYPVLAHYNADGTLRSVEVVFQNEEDEDDYVTFNEDPYGHD